VAATEAAAGEAAWRRTRSAAVDPPPSRSGGEEPEAGQAGQDLEAATHAAWQDRAAAEEAMREASAQAWERAAEAAARPAVDPAWEPTAAVIEPQQAGASEPARTEPAVGGSDVDEEIVVDSPPRDGGEGGVERRGEAVAPPGRAQPAPAARAASGGADAVVVVPPRAAMDREQPAGSGSSAGTAAQLPWASSSEAAVVGPRTQEDAAVDALRSQLRGRDEHLRAFVREEQDRARQLEHAIAVSSLRVLIVESVGARQRTHWV